MNKQQTASINSINAKQQAGSKGGRVTVQRHGRAHMRTIGRKGAAAFWKLYRLTPTGLNDFAIVKRDTGEAIALLSGKPQTTGGL